MPDDILDALAELPGSAQQHLPEPQPTYRPDWYERCWPIYMATRPVGEIPILAALQRGDVAALTEHVELLDRRVKAAVLRGNPLA